LPLLVGCFAQARTLNTLGARSGAQRARNRHWRLSSKRSCTIPPIFMSTPPCHFRPSSTNPTTLEATPNKIKTDNAASTNRSNRSEITDSAIKTERGHPTNRTNRFNVRCAGLIHSPERILLITPRLNMKSSVGGFCTVGFCVVGLTLPRRSRADLIGPEPGLLATLLACGARLLAGHACSEAGH
jgi:hypothetical protein